MKNIHKILILIICIPKLGFAIDEKFAYNKEKTMSKSFDVNNDAETNITNSYGNINVYLWDENKVSIQVNIKVSGNNEKKIAERLNAIEIDFQSSQNRVIATTDLNGNSWKGNNNVSYEINYIIKIPKNGSVKLNNKYGNISVDKLNGSAAIDCHYGSLFLGQLNNKNNSINLSYSQNSTIDFVDKVNLKSQYSDINFQKVNQINIDGNYNSFNFQTVGNFTMSSNYTRIKASSIQKAVIDGNYLTLKLGEIGNTTTINSNYSDIQLIASNKTDAISIDGNYTNTKITCHDDYAFSFEARINYGSLKDNLGLKYSEKSEKNTSKSYSGYHISQGKSSISISSNYGSIQLLNN